MFRVESEARGEPQALRALGAGSLALLILWFFLPPAWALEPSERTDFVRFVREDGGRGRLETAVVTYKRDDGVEVALVAAVHIGDAGYYKRLQRIFEGYDAVLYEMVKPEGVAPVPRRGGGGMLGLFQRGLGDALELEFQLEAIDYLRPNFVHADLNPATFEKLQRERGENMLTFLLRSMFSAWEREAAGKGAPVSVFDLLAALASEDSARALKLLFARELEGAETALAGFGSTSEEDRTVIVGERNRRAIEVLEREIKNGRKTLAIFYGAAHMPDLELRLTRDLGFKKAKARWITAWDIRPKSERRKDWEDEPLRRRV